MAKVEVVKANIPSKNIPIAEGKEVRDDNGNVWTVDVWEDKFGKRVAKVIHPISHKPLWIDSAGSQLRVSTNGEKFISATKRFPLKPTSPDGTGPGSKSASGGEPRAVRYGRTVTLTSGALELWTDYVSSWKLAQKAGMTSEQEVSLVVSELIQKHFPDIIEELENRLPEKPAKRSRTPRDPKAALSALAEQLGITLTPEQLSLLKG